MTEPEFNKIFAKNLRSKLEEKGLTQKALAAKLDVAVSTVGYWCNAIKTPRMDKVDKMCKIFNCKRTDLLEEKIVKTGEWIDVPLLGNTSILVGSKIYELPKEIFDIVQKVIEPYEVKKGANHNDR